MRTGTQTHAWRCGIIGVIFWGLEAIVGGAASAAVSNAVPEVPVEVLKARAEAARALLGKVATLSLAAPSAGEAGNVPVGKVLPKARAEELLVGVEEAEPVRFYDDRTCEVVWRLSWEQLQKNIEALAARMGSERGGEKPRLTGAGSGWLEVTGRWRASAGESHRRQAQPPPWPPSQLDGWADADAYDRVRAEQAALNRAREGLIRQVLAIPVGDGKTLKTFLSDKIEAGEQLAQFLKKLLPRYKAYLAGGIVEVEVRLPGARLSGELARINGQAIAEQDRLLPEALAAFAKEISGKDYIARGYALVTANGGEVSAPVARWRVLNAEEIPSAEMPAPKGESDAGSGVEKADGKR